MVFLIHISRFCNDFRLFAQFLIFISTLFFVWMCIMVLLKFSIIFSAFVLPHLKVLGLGVLASAAPDPARPPVPLVKLGKPGRARPRHAQEPPSHQVRPPRHHPLTVPTHIRHFYRLACAPLPLFTWWCRCRPGVFLPRPHHHLVRPLRRAGGHCQRQLSPSARLLRTQPMKSARGGGGGGQAVRNSWIG